MAWEPEPDSLRQLSTFLRDSLNGQNKNAQKQAETMLAQAKSSPDINNYLTFLFSSSQAPPGFSDSTEDFHTVRSAAAVMLKNNISNGYKTIPEASLALIRSWVPNSLQDKNPQIRSYAGNVITEIVKRGGILSWPQLLPELFALVGNLSANVTEEAQEGAMAALTKICEDNNKLLDKEYQGQRPLSVLFPKLIEFTTSQVSKVRSLALTSINVIIPQKPQALLVNLDLLLTHLFQLANDPDLDVHKQLCLTFVQIVEIRPDKIQPYIRGLVDYIIAQQQKVEEEELACAAAEFWLSVGEHKALWMSLEPYLNKIIPMLLDSMVYSEENIALLEGGEDDADKEDRADDIKPVFAKAKDEIEGFSDDDDGNPEDQWNLRKCSAAALDVFAKDFRGQVFEEILPYLETNLRHEEWPHREAAVFALGAVAKGCMDVVTPHLQNLVPYLISLLNDTEPLVRQITCWTLGRYSSWGANLRDPNHQSHFVPMIKGILNTMLDRNKKVQEAGASAFAHLEENAGRELSPYYQQIVEQFVNCFHKYKDRNMFILYDCVQTLAERVGEDLARPELVKLLMPALIHRWEKVADQSRELIPLLQCLSYVATALGNAFGAYAPPICSRCIEIIHQNIEDYAVAVDPSDAPDTDFLVTSLDLLSAIVQVLDIPMSAELVSSSEPRFFELLTFCAKNPANNVRQSSYTLLGHCAIYVFPQLQPFLPGIMLILIEQLDVNSVIDEQIEDGFSAINNACWSAGEISIQYGKGMAPYVEPLFQRLLNIIVNHNIPQSVHENAAIAIGRLGLENSELIAPHISMFATQFLDSMDAVDYTEEKASAVTGFTLTVGQNPLAMEKDLVHFFTAIARYKHENKGRYKEGLSLLFGQALHAYKGLIPDFRAFLSQLTPVDQQELLRTYDL